MNKGALYQTIIRPRLVLSPTETMQPFVQKNFLHLTAFFQQFEIYGTYLLLIGTSSLFNFNKGAFNERLSSKGK